MIDLTAIIMLDRIPGLGLNNRIKSGFRPSFNYEGQLVACIVNATEGSEWIEIGRQQLVTIRLPYAEQLGWQFHPGTRFHLNVGATVIGEGTVTEK